MFFYFKYFLTEINHIGIVFDCTLLLLNGMGTSLEN